ncbi:MAG TPA: hypothetical protein VFO16_11320, partial [Pseudonocardiaceae bacterium]|nr:hypothetical protein [Pseudonocardiaceae bacterium]
MIHHPRPGTELPRRAVVVGTGILAASTALGACSGYGGQSATESAPSTTPGSAASSNGPNSSPPPGEKIAAASDIPVGGGLVVADQKVVVTQPS